MSHERPTTILVVAERSSTGASPSLDGDSVRGRVVAPDEAVAALDEDDPDCLVVCGSSLPAAVAATASRRNVPVVDFDSTSEVDRGSASDVDVRALLEAVDDAVAGASSVDPRRITRLHAGSAALTGATDRETLLDRVVDIATDVLDFDAAVVFVAEEDGFRNVAAASPRRMPDRLDADHGLTAKAYRTGESALVGDIAADDEARSTTHNYRSGVAVPFGDRYVFDGLAAEPDAYDERDLELAELLCSHAAEAEARISAERHLQARERTVTELHRAAPRLIDAQDEAALFDLTVEIAELVLEFDHSSLLLADGDRFRFVASSDPTDEEWAPNAGILGRTYEEGRSFRIDDAQTEATARPAAETTRAAISVPFGDDGVFQVLARTPGAFDETDLELAELLVSYASATRERIRSEAALRESRRVIERLHAASADLAAAETEADLFDRAIAAAEEVLSFDQCMVAIRESDTLVPVAESADSPPGSSRRMHISEGLAGKTARTGESYRLNRIEGDPDADPVREEYRSAVSVPIGDAGVFQAVAAEEEAFDDDDLDRAELLMAHAAVTLDRVRTDAERRDERDRLRALFDNIPGAAIAYEMDEGRPHIRRINEAFERTFGYEASEVVGECLDEYIVPPEHESDASEYNRRLVRGERLQAEVERLAHDGPRHFLMQVIPLQVGAANSRGYAIYSDVSERKRREEELRRQNQRLDEFASVVSHDLRNPLNVATGYLELGRESDDPSKFDRVEAALERMDDLITDLLVLAREGRDVGETDAVSLAESARLAWGNVATEGATLRIETDRRVDADADRLAALFENLFRNSIEHGRPDDAGDGSRGGEAGADDRAGESSGESDGEEAPTLTVTVGDRAADARSGFYVADDGAGIDSEMDVFEAGATTSREGTGFGLAIVKGVAEAHGWSVSVGESAAGGARFDFVV